MNFNFECSSAILNSERCISQVKRRKLAESIAKNIMKEPEAHQVSKRLCTPTEGTDNTAVINVVVEDTEEKQLLVTCDQASLFFRDGKELNA